MSNEQLRELLAEIDRAAEALRRAMPRQRSDAMKPIGEVVAVVIEKLAQGSGGHDA